MLVLASASPRRKELLAQAGFLFGVAVSSVPEEHRPSEDPIVFATRLARDKAQAVFNTQLDADEDPLIVVGADTIVVAPDGEILGKPNGAKDAARMLRLLAGATHQVITGVCVVSRGGVEIAAEVTSVAMQNISAAEIEQYIATGEPADKAGAYAIQGYAARWIPRIQGDYSNVVGLPLALVSSMIEGVRFRLSQSEAVTETKL
jgi:septum formation protein